MIFKGGLPKASWTSSKCHTGRSRLGSPGCIALLKSKVETENSNTWTFLSLNYRGPFVFHLTRALVSDPTRGSLVIGTCVARLPCRQEAYLLCTSYSGIDGRFSLVNDWPIFATRLNPCDPYSHSTSWGCSVLHHASVTFPRATRDTRPLVASTQS